MIKNLSKRIFFTQKSGMRRSTSRSPLHLHMYATAFGVDNRGGCADIHGCPIRGYPRLTTFIPSGELAIVVRFGGCRRIVMFPDKGRMGGGRTSVRMGDANPED